MSLDKNGLFEEKIMSLYRDTLDYLAETGFDIKGKVSNEWKMNMSPSNIEKLFDRLGEGAYDLSVPYKVGEDVLSKTFMEVYGLEKEIDLVRYIRIIKIILDNDTSREDSPYLEGHISSLKLKFAHGDHGYQEDAIIRALHIYEQSLGKRAQCHTILSKSDYVSFARILNTKFSLYNSKEKKGLAIIFLTNIHIKLLKLLQTDHTRAMLFNRLSYYNITDIKSEKELLPLINDPKARAELIKKINIWLSKQQNHKVDALKQSFKMLYCYLTDEDLLKILESFGYLDTLFNNLKEFNIADFKDTYELGKLKKKPKERAELLRKLKEYCEKEC